MADGEQEQDQEQQSNLITLKNGAIYDRTKGHIVANPGGGTTAITQATASEMHALRAEKYRRAAAAGLARVHPSNTPMAAWGYIVERQSQLATTIDKGRSSTEAARFVGQAIGVLGVKQDTESQARQPAFAPGLILGAWLDDLRRFREQLKDE